MGVALGDSPASGEAQIRQVASDRWPAENPPIRGPVSCSPHAHNGGLMRRLFRLKTLVLILLAAGIGAIVALVVNQKQKFSGMSEEEIREYLDLKLAGRMSEEQVAQIQDAVVAAVKRSPEVADMVEEVVEDAIEETEIEEAADAAEVEDVVEELELEEAAEEA